MSQARALMLFQTVCFWIVVLCTAVVARRLMTRPFSVWGAIALIVECCVLVYNRLVYMKYRDEWETEKATLERIGPYYG